MYSTVSHDGHLIHRPSGIAAALARVGVLDLRRQQFFEPAHRLTPCADGPARLRMLGHECRAAARATSARVCSSSSWISRVPMTTASATCADRARGGRIADAEADADRHADSAADARQHRRHAGGVEVRRRRSRPSATRSRRSRWPAAPPARMRSSVRGRREQEDQVEPAAAQRGGKGLAFLGRVVDDQHAVDAGGAAASTKAPVRRRADRSVRSGWRNPSAPPACRSLPRRNSRTMASTCAMPMPRASARSDAFWITGPSAIGSENGTPSSMMSAPPSASAGHDLGGDVGERVAGGDVRDQRLAAVACASASKVAAMRLICAPRTVAWPFDAPGRGTRAGSRSRRRTGRRRCRCPCRRGPTG